MTSKRRIGELLLMKETVDPWVLSQTLRVHTGAPRQRLVSLLISRAQLDSDDGAMALAEQLDYPAALQRHLEHRDPACEPLIPRELVQRWAVLPLTRARDGRLVVVARDPSTVLAAALEHATKLPIVLAVTPGIHLEKLIRSIYGMSEDIGAEPVNASSIDELGGVIEFEPPAPVRPARTVSALWFNDGTPELPKRASQQESDRIDATLVDIENTITIAAAERRALAYANQRWRATLLLGVADGAAIGRRGDGARLTSVDTIVLPLGLPSTVQVAYAGASATSLAPSSAIQLHLCHLLDDASMPAAAPIVVGGAVQGVLAVGDPRRGGVRESVKDLARLADSLGASHERFAGPRRG